MSDFSLNIPISKVDEEQRIVYGYATKEELDRQGDIVDYEASKKAFGAWPGNIREQHDPKRVIGKKVSMEFDDDNKQVLVGAYVSKSPDGENAWTKVKEGLFTGFSIGGKIKAVIKEKMTKDDGSEGSATRITDYDLTELSLVDVPACPSAQFVMVKSENGIAKEVDELHEATFDLPWFMKSFTYSIEQVNRLEKAAQNKDIEKQSKENAMADAKDEKLEKVNVVGGEERDHLAEPVNEAEEVVETTEKAVAVHAGDARDEKAEPVVPEIAGKTEDEAAAHVADQKGEVAPKADQPVAEEPKKGKSQKKADEPEMTKGLYTVAQFGELISNLVWLTEDAEWENQYEGDDSTVPGQLRAAVKTLVGIYKQMAVEEADEAVGDDVEVVELADRPADLVKMVGDTFDARKDEMVKAFTEAVAGKVAESLKPLEDRIAKMEAQPAGKGPVRTYAVVEKVADAPSEASEYENLIKQADELPATASVSERSALAQRIMKAQSRMRPVTINE